MVNQEYKTWFDIKKKIQKYTQVSTFAKLSTAESLHPNAKHSVKDAKSRALQHNMHR